MSWPTCAAGRLPPGVTLRRWFATVSVGAESVFLDERFRRTRVFVDDSEFLTAICQSDEVVSFQAFERQPASKTLQGRLGVLAPDARAGFLGAFGSPRFEAVWVTLATNDHAGLSPVRVDQCMVNS